MEAYIKNLEQYIEIRGGECPLDLLESGRVQLPFRPISCFVNNKSEDLRFPIFAPKQIEYSADLSESGRRVYTRALCFMLYKAVSEQYPEAQLRIEHSIFRGYFCRLFRPTGAEATSGTSTESTPLTLTAEDVKRLETKMRELAAADIPFERHERLTDDVLPIMRRQHLISKVLLYETTGQLYTTYYTLGGLADSYYGHSPSTGYARYSHSIPMPTASS